MCDLGRYSVFLDSTPFLHIKQRLSKYGSNRQHGLAMLCHFVRPTHCTLTFVLTVRLRINVDCSFMKGYSINLSINRKVYELYSVSFCFKVSIQKHRGTTSTTDTEHNARQRSNMPSKTCNEKLAQHSTEKNRNDFATLRLSSTRVTQNMCTKCLK